MLNHIECFLDFLSKSLVTEVVTQEDGLDDAPRFREALVRAGKILYVGISDTPAWIIARANTLAELKNWTSFIVTQIEYNLHERTSEREVIPMAHALDLGITAWSPLAGGLLTGKYVTASNTDQRRLDLSPNVDRRNAPNARQEIVVQELLGIAQQHNASPAQIALAWLLKCNIIPILGARTLSQLHQNLVCLDVILTEHDFQRLNKASQIELGFPHEYVTQPMAQATMYGGMFNQLDIHRTNELPEVLQRP